MPKAAPSLFLRLALLLLLAACAAPENATPTPSPVTGKNQKILSETPMISNIDLPDLGPPPHTLVPPTAVYIPKDGCRVAVELVKHEITYTIHDDHYGENFHYEFRIDPKCVSPTCVCFPAIKTNEINFIEGGGYEIQLPNSPDVSPGQALCPLGCDVRGQMVYSLTLQTRGLYAVYLGEQLLGYLDVPEGTSSSSGPPPQATRPTGASTSTLPPGTTYPLPSPPRYVPATPNPLWTLTPTVNPFDYPAPPPGFGPYP